MVQAQQKVVLTVGDRSVSATLADNAATRALVAQLSASPVTVSLDDYGGFEKVGPLPQSLPTSNSQITTVPGDIMLYQGSNIVVFYGTNSWSYTPLGRIDGATADSVRQFLGSGSVTMTISLPDQSGIGDITADPSSTVDTVYDLQGKPCTRRPLPPGLYITRGKKIQK